ncbi:hypothetical protein [Burkholderia sp. Ac-20365]|uniref:hypothetical protein n=1 Tax=Burkholderia sp. Ac-20365 TaxID=2703897 RepID=UPI00197BFDCC|nr:hypothetical protein [Burkholderia sp. Ac-20365]MBN3761079.1 hypothetical protein [Burkholderia sp. Ac-20365]
MTTPETSAARQGMLLVRELKQRGWTTQLITRFLGKPDITTAAKGAARGRPAGLYLVDRVLRVECSADYLSARHTAQARNKTFVDALETKKATLLNFCNAIPLTLPNVAVSHLLESARRELVSKGFPDTDASVMDRALEIALRSFEHADSKLAIFNWHPGVRQARARLEERKLQAVASQYPTLATTCATRATTGALIDKVAA